MTLFYLYFTGDNVTYITRPNDKKKILFYNDKYCQFNMDEDFTKLWRGTSETLYQKFSN